LVARLGICNPLETPLPTAPALFWSPYSYFALSSQADVSRVTYEVRSIRVLVSPEVIT
jgi:hypothetical protein